MIDDIVLNLDNEMDMRIVFESWIPRMVEF